MSDYGAVRASALKFKGGKDASSHKKKKKKKNKAKRKHKEAERQEPLRHGAWWQVKRPEDLTGNVIMESESGKYVIALDNGTVSVGESTKNSEGPDVQEILTIMCVSDNRVAIKTPFNRFLSVESESGDVTGLKEAIGALELWQPIFDDEGLVLFQGPNKKVLEVAPGEKAKCSSAVGEGNTHFKLWSCAERKKEKKPIGDAYDVEDETGLTTTESKIARRFQSWQDGKLRLSGGDANDLKRAKQEGKLHEALLDRRAKMKSDRYCM
ncbi:hypothetical protein PTSG_01137 [Salpingoeca rosetta]|uniref:Protein FRG1 n=1 Tax=Salpingoeca rosetta (strain ATCC 50818 / BSB-021) TaxID=946362 RepID=F2U0X2_SALR5|nr:uncharacterized protein PTSG_01137 [Salpingoeca rosetta]EGD80546.1 hypothetical protein PTSG_01137 [Salpingoeca rosetta]|eukprot:XP_004997107.1 hypothetical protein PTSG_01137 [Salpingoeca rosetta]